MKVTTVMKKGATLKTEACVGAQTSVADRHYSL